MKKILSFVAVTFVSFVSCTREMEFRQALTDIACDVSAIMPEFKSGGDIADTKASLESVVRINWSAGDKLAIINLTTGKQLGGCLVADNNGSKTSFSPTNLVGTISAGDKLVFWYNPSDDIIVEQEQMYSPISVDLTEQNGGQDDVPIVGYAQYTASADNGINAENIAFTFLVSYMQLALSALPASTSITALEVSDVNSKGEFKINDGNFVFEKTKGKVKLIDPFTANSKGANVRYFSMFQSEAEVSARVATITANGQEYQTTWIKSAINNGSYYQSVATGFANEFIQFADDAFKAYCVSHYDGNGDGEISFAEAAAVTSYADFSDEEKSSIVSIYELAYFPAQLGLPKFEGCTALKNIAIPGTVTEIPEKCFKGCTSLGEINIPDNVTAVGKNAFEGCTSLQYFSGNMASDDHRFLINNKQLLAYAPDKHNIVTIPSNVKSIEESVFEGCKNIVSINLNAVSEIKERAFAGCSSISSLNLVESVISICDEAFSGCSKLNTVYAQRQSAPSLGSNVFLNCADDLRIFVSELSASQYSADIRWAEYNITSRTWHQIFYTTIDEEPLVLDESIKYYAPGNWLYLGPEISLLSNEYISGRGVLTFSGNVGGFVRTASPFTDQSRLKTIEFPDAMNALPSLNNCSELTSVRIPESINMEQWLYNESSGTFRNCPKLNTFTGNHICGEGLFIILDETIVRCANNCPEEITVPSQATSIERYSFQGCNNIKRITFPSTIQSIGLQAFRDLQVDEYRFTSTVPPELTGDNWTFWFSSNGKVYVPNSAVDDYKTASERWAYISDRIVGY